jgi:hypothetical protein
LQKCLGENHQEQDNKQLTEHHASICWSSEASITEYWAREAIVDYSCQRSGKACPLWRVPCGSLLSLCSVRCELPPSAIRNPPLEPIISLSMRVGSAL